MEHSIFGQSGGRLVVYFHGAPGSMGEAEVFHHDAKQHGLQVVCQNRFSIDRSIVTGSYFQLLVDDIVRLAQGKAVDIIGFSIGAFVALQVSRLMPGQVRSLHLISPAAPLEGGDFLKSMAGGDVFWLAKNWPRTFKLLSYWQGLLAALAPKLLYTMLFASAVAGDKDLAAGDDFKEFMRRVLQECFCGNVPGYLRDVHAYVSPWQSSLQNISAKTQLWHGDQDNWSPKEMSEYLQQQIPHCVEVHRMQGLSHYSTLYAAAPRICRQLHQLG
jgi:pimeloyl-ACP methyl ester carboxylesterase